MWAIKILVRLLIFATAAILSSSKDASSPGFARGPAPFPAFQHRVKCSRSCHSPRRTTAHYAKANNERHTDGGCNTRRAVLGQALAVASSCITLTTNSNIALAVDNNSLKPFAPLENLLPATRVRVLIHQAAETAQSLVDEQKSNNAADSSSSSSSNKQQLEFVAALQDLLLQPHTFVLTKQEASASQTYLQIDTWSQWKRARQKEASQRLSFQLDNSNVDINNPLTGANEALEQWGERRQFERLQKQQRSLEQASSMRTAFNAYTNNLVFGDRYTLTASRDEKSRMIRTYDQLPDVTSVVRSDLDLRDLYRNEVLTYFEDAQAELLYQLKQQQQQRNGNSGVDGTELLALLRQAEKSCLEWFKFVPEQDVKDAFSMVLAEDQKAQSR